MLSQFYCSISRFLGSLILIFMSKFIKLALFFFSFNYIGFFFSTIHYRYLLSISICLSIYRDIAIVYVCLFFY